jgi:hypothetical protein
MGRLFAFIVVFGLGIGFLVPGHSPSRTGNPHRVTAPSEPARETDLERSSSGHFYTYAKVNGELVKFVVDTGADVVALTKEDAERVGMPVDPSSFTVIGEGASRSARHDRQCRSRRQAGERCPGDRPCGLVAVAARPILSVAHQWSADERRLYGAEIIEPRS